MRLKERNKSRAYFTQSYHVETIFALIVLCLLGSYFIKLLRYKAILDPIIKFNDNKQSKFVEMLQN